MQILTLHTHTHMLTWAPETDHSTSASYHWGFTNDVCGFWQLVLIHNLTIVPDTMNKWGTVCKGGENWETFRAKHLYKGTHWIQEPHKIRTLPAVPAPCTVEPLCKAVPLEYRVPFYKGQGLLYNHTENMTVRYQWPRDTPLYKVRADGVAVGLQETGFILRGTIMRFQQLWQEYGMLAPPYPEEPRTFIHGGANYEYHYRVTVWESCFSIGRWG